MARRIARLCLLAALAAVPASAEQSPAPKLTNAQRTALHTVVSAVDAASAAPVSPDASWQIHVMRASDGSHYVAFSTAPPIASLPATPVVLYVRLASRVSGTPVTPERSAVMDWLTGLRRDPLPLRSTRVIAVASGELPVGGPLAMSTRGGAVGQSTAALELVRREGERKKAQDAERERQRRAALEGAEARAPLELFPFEDFDLAATPVREAGKPSLLQRSFTAGPGDYDLYVGWIDAADRNAGAHVLKRAINLPPAHASGLALSSVIVADAVGVRETPYPPDRQTAHPYAIGATDITPARDNVFSSDERLAIAFQVINPLPDLAGKPDVTIAFRLIRVTPAGEESVGLLTPQSYTASTLPVDFDLGKGHPVFAAVGMPLTRLARGAYRLRITAADRLAGSSASADASFRIVGTPAELLKAAPPLGTPFVRDAVLAPDVLQPFARSLTPASPSRGLTELLDATAAGRFATVLHEIDVTMEEQATRALLRAVALYALGGEAPTVLAQVQQAVARGAPRAPAHVFVGAARALAGNDREAVLAWQVAGDAAAIAAALQPLLFEAYLRQNDPTHALAALDTQSAEWRRGRAAALIALGRNAEALTLIDGRLGDRPDDREAQWLLLHALFAQFVMGEGAGATSEGQARLRQAAADYIEAKGTHGALAAEWIAVLPEVTQ